jgi:hypothetical protein
MTLTATDLPCRLAEADWHDRQRAHAARVDGWIAPRQQRAARGETHPVEDFLFTYYSFRPAWLRRWHPGPDVALEGESAEEFLRWPNYRRTPEGVMVDPARLEEKRHVFVRWLHDLLVAQRDRPAWHGCFGLHEWAMVYRQSPEEIRHRSWPLRHPPEELARIVESSPVSCTHFDAFRFFTASARPLNRHQPTRETVPSLEQRGCLHANMDLYKWAYKLAPYAPSELVADCFALALAIREVDMRASPYDLRQLGYEPIPIETASGRTEYERLQREFTARSEPLRARLIALTARLLQAAPPLGQA